MDHTAGDFGNPLMLEHCAMFEAAYRTAIFRVFISLGLANKIIDAIVNEQGYSTPLKFSCLGKKVIKMLVSAIH